jgi:hypothetical protein
MPAGINVLRQIEANVVNNGEKPFCDTNKHKAAFPCRCLRQVGYLKPVDDTVSVFVCFSRSLPKSLRGSIHPTCSLAYCHWAQSCWLH